MRIRTSCRDSATPGIASSARAEVSVATRRPALLGSRPSLFLLGRIPSGGALRLLSARSLFQRQQLAVFPRRFLLDRLDVYGDFNARKRGANCPFNASDDFVGAFDGQFSGHQQMKVGEAPGPGLAGAQGVKVHARFETGMDRRADGRL